MFEIKNYYYYYYYYSVPLSFTNCLPPKTDPAGGI